jgi:hypothetical protein
MNDNICEKTIINARSGNLRFRAILEKVTDEKFLRVYKHFNLKPNLYKIIQIFPYEQNNYEQKTFELNVFITVDFYDESDWSIITLCWELNPNIPFGIAHQHYITQVTEDFNINNTEHVILWKYYAKLLSIRFIAKHCPGLLEYNLKSMRYTFEAFSSDAPEKLNLVYMRDEPKNSYYLEDQHTIRMKDESIVASMVNDFLFLKKTPDLNAYLNERQNIIL